MLNRLEANCKNIIPTGQISDEYDWFSILSTDYGGMNI
jgi:hypothetical protein